MAYAGTIANAIAAALGGAGQIPTGLYQAKEMERQQALKEAMAERQMRTQEQQASAQMSEAESIRALRQQQIDEARKQRTQETMSLYSGTKTPLPPGIAEHATEIGLGGLINPDGTVQEMLPADVRAKNALMAKQLGIDQATLDQRWKIAMMEDATRQKQIGVDALQARNQGRLVNAQIPFIEAQTKSINAGTGRYNTPTGRGRGGGLSLYERLVQDGFKKSLLMGIQDPAADAMEVRRIVQSAKDAIRLMAAEPGKSPQESSYLLQQIPDDATAEAIAREQGGAAVGAYQQSIEDKALGAAVAPETGTGSEAPFGFEPAPGKPPRQQNPQSSNQPSGLWDQFGSILPNKKKLFPGEIWG